MTPAHPLVLTDLSMLLCLGAIMLVPLMLAGLALVNSGFGRSRSAAHSVLSSLCVFATAALVYLVFGFAMQGTAGAPAMFATIAGKQWSLIGADRWMLRGIVFDGSARPLIACLQIFCVALAAAIPLGSGSERMRLGASCASAAFIAAITYPIFAHWVWGGGWLAQVGAIDAGGAGVIQAVGGLTALSLTWILGPRRGKYAASGMAIPGHNMVIVLFGCMLTLTGWLGLDTAAAILFAGATPDSVVAIVINNLAAASAAVLTALVVTRVRYGKPDASITANGFIIGLVAISGSCSFVSPPEAIAIGLVAGLAVPFAVEWLDRLGFDDPSGVVAVHGLGGIWGVLAVGIFIQGHTGQWLAQFAMLSALLGFVLPASYVFYLLLDRISPMRIRKEGERQGLDMSELGAGAYPEQATTDTHYR